ncbi:MAG: hypothetical protein NZ765_12975 [Anaerolineae bacterium]|nr:hypothetical protein [Anaerolineae bacterium]MDW8070786.1 hypothetical protein [Anaerolineae bacterium]
MKEDQNAPWRSRRGESRGLDAMQGGVSLVERRYRVLRIIATLCKVAGVVVGALVALVILGICLNLVFGVSAMTLFEPEHPFSRPRLLPWWGWGVWPGMMLIPGIGSLVVVILVVLGGGLHALALYGLGSLIDLLLALEENTRAVAETLQRRG